MQINTLQRVVDAYTYIRSRFKSQCNLLVKSCIQPIVIAHTKFGIKGSFENTTGFQK